MLFIDTPKKIHNQEYEKLKLTPLEVSLRKDIGKVIPPDYLRDLISNINDLFNNTNYRNEIINKREKYIFNWMSSAKIGANYIIKRVKNLP